MNGPIYLRTLRTLDVQITIAEAALTNVHAAADTGYHHASAAVRKSIGEHLRRASEITQAHIRFVQEQEDADGNGE